MPWPCANEVSKIIFVFFFLPRDLLASVVVSLPDAVTFDWADTLLSTSLILAEAPALARSKKGIQCTELYWS